MLTISRPTIAQADIDAVAAVLLSGNLVQGARVAEFEALLAKYLGADYVVAVSSGTAALHLALLVAGIGPGDAVLVPGFTFVASVNAIALVGARPVFVDVASNTYCITEDALRDAITAWEGPERLTAVMPVLEFGHPAQLSTLESVAKEHGLQVIVDAACALGTADNGARVGATQALSCYSFHPRKTLTTGEGGAIATNNKVFAEHLRRLRSHGIDISNGERVCVEPGFNYRMTDIAAALGMVQLNRFPAALDARRELAHAYADLLTDMRGISLPHIDIGHSWQSYMIVLDARVRRATVIARLREMNIEAGPGAQSLIDQPAYRDHFCSSMESWHSRRLGSHGLVLPFCESYTVKDVEYVVTSLRQVLAVDDAWLP